MWRKWFYVLFSNLLIIAAFSFINTPILAKEDNDNIDLDQLTLQELLNLEVTTAGRQREKISDIPASVVVVTREDIEAYGYQTLEEILRNIPGLYFTNDYFTQNFGLRGFWTVAPQRNFIILVNDIPQTEFLASAHQLEQINVPVEAIDRIEVVRGPMSVMYGSGAFFGAINIKTNLPGSGFPLNMASVAIGTQKTYRLFTRASNDAKDFQYAFNASFYNTYGIDTPLSKMVSGPNILPSLGLSIDYTTGGKLENLEKYFNFSGSSKGFFFNSSYSESNDEVSVVLPSLDNGTQMVYRALRLNFGFKKRISGKTRLKTMFTYFLNRWTFDYDMIFNDIYAVQTNGASGYKIELVSFFDPNPNLNITFGLTYNKVLDVSSEYTVPALGLLLVHNILAEGESMITRALYTQINYKLSDQFRIVGGIRLEQTPSYTMERKEGNPNFFDTTDPNWGKYTTSQATYSHTKLEFIPRLALIWGINNNNYLKFLYGKAINHPSFFQNFTMLDSPSMPILKPETIQTLELNYVGNLSNWVSISLSLFYNMLDNLIYRTYFSSGSDVTTYWANVGEMTTKGLELTFMYRPNKKFNLEISGTYQDTTDKRPGYTEDLEAGYSPKLLGYLKSSYFFTRDICLSFTGNYVDSMLPYYDHTLSNPGRIGAEVKGYFLLGTNLRVSEIFETGVYANLRISNLLDQEIRYPTTSNNANYVYRGTIGSGISFLFTLGIKF